MSQVEIKVPDLGGSSDVPVIDIAVTVGDTVALDDTLLTLESDKATMDIPASAAGVITALRVKVGDKLSEGMVVAVVEASGAAAVVKEEKQEKAATPAPAAAASAPVAAPAPVPVAPAAASAAPVQSGTYASPSIRQFARELGVDLTRVPATGPKGRILKEDVTAFIKKVMQGEAVPTPVGSSLGGSLDLLPWPKVDFAKFGPVETKPLSRIKKISGQNLARNWVMIPAVTYHEEADITDLEAFRVAINKENEKSGQKITMLAFIIKACELALKKFPEFNSSLDGDNLVLKKYFNIAFAADTPNCLVVPGIKNFDQKKVSQLAAE